MMNAQEYAERAQLVARIDHLERRIAAAEVVCGLVGWLASDGKSDRGKALTQAWTDWHHAYGKQAVPVSEEIVAELAGRRERAMAETIERIRTEFPDVYHRVWQGPTP